MKTCYVDYEHHGIADLVAPGELWTDWTITRINIPEKSRGNGYGSRLLRRITDDADAEVVKLVLEPFPSGPLDYDALVAWYTRHGFRMTRHGYMLREPKVSGGN